MSSRGNAPAEDRDVVRRLLEAAAHEFAKHGFVAARIREIAASAGANLAAVNYHFGGKEGLYRATLDMLRKRARDEVPGESPQLRALPPEEQLRALTRVMLARFLGGPESSPLSRILAHELLDPTPAFEEVLRDIVGPQFLRLSEVVRRILGPRASEEDVAFASFSVLGQWVFSLFGRDAFERLHPNLPGDAALLDRFLEETSTFSIAGLRARREHLERGKGRVHSIRHAPAPTAAQGAGKAKPPGMHRPSGAKRRSSGRDGVEE